MKKKDGRNQENILTLVSTLQQIIHIYIRSIISLYFYISTYYIYIYIHIDIICIYIYINTYIDILSYIYIYMCYN